MHQTDYTNKDKTITDVWRADDWYRYLMRVSRDKIMSDSDISKYYPVDLITKDIIKKRYLAQQRKKTYDSIIMSHTSALPDHLKPQLLEKIQKKRTSCCHRLCTDPYACCHGSRSTDVP